MNNSLSIIAQNGPIFWLLFMLAFLALIFTFERALYLQKGKIQAGEFLSGIKNLLRQNRLIEALTVCEEANSPVAAMLKSALVHSKDSKSAMKMALEGTAISIIPNLERRISTLALIAKVAILVGLLGTLVSLYNAFNVTALEGPYVNASIYATWVNDALLSSIFGFLISIFSWIAHHFLSERVRSLVHDMEWVSQDILEFLITEKKND